MTGDRANASTNARRGHGARGPETPMDALATAPGVIVHHRDQARTALAAASATGHPLRLLSAPGAARFSGALWFVAMIGDARRTHPGARSLAVLDCGSDPGIALGALRSGVEAVAVTLRGAALIRLKALATMRGQRVLTRRGRRVLDLQDHEQDKDGGLGAVRDFLSRKKRRRVAHPIAKHPGLG